jgi:hypothetical protein
MQYASKQNFRAQCCRRGNTIGYFLVIEETGGTHAVSEELIGLAEDTIPEANFFIHLRYYTYLPVDGVMIYIGGVLFSCQRNL